jgi:sigma-B regulation protein RsbU (phosphoserine phosphatase)
VRILFSFLLALPLFAQSIRYQHGDDPRWADPKFDDSAWPVATPGKFPMPVAGSSKGMVWLRYRVTVPPDQSPLAIRLERDYGTCTPGEFWVNGVRIGSQGQFPPQPLTLQICETNVFVLPQGAAQPGQTAIVAWRGWVAPIFTSGVSYTPPWLFSVEIGPRDFMQSRQNEIRANRRLSLEPDFILFLLQSLIGFSLLAIWWHNRTQTLLWFAAFVLLWSFYGLRIMSMGPGSTHAAFWAINLWGWMAFYLALIQFMKCVLEPPAWTIVALRSVCVPWLAITWVPILWVEDNELVRLLCAIALVGGVSLGFVLFIGQMGLTGWLVFRGRPETRGLAFTLFFAGLAYLLVDNMGVATKIGVGNFNILLDNLCTTLVIITMCYQLLRRLWLDWRKKEDLDAEFEAAREMQESLVQRLPETPGFTVEAVYRPASQVGGDFYRVFNASDGAIFVVAGDVSGKGLKAAMTVSVLVGAMEAVETREPGLFLNKLNAVAKAHLQSGFVTCCAALIQPDGATVIANAGHLPPYMDGHEAELETGLPLGLMPDVHYAETRTQANQFMFVSDGVVEAENAERELLGFDRTREISTRPAREIAETAYGWGQNDDITVVTVRRIV